jgi:hypothetical protein
LGSGVGMGRHRQLRKSMRGSRTSIQEVFNPCRRYPPDQVHKTSRPDRLPRREGDQCFVAARK